MNLSQSCIVSVCLALTFLPAATALAESPTGSPPAESGGDASAEASGSSTTPPTDSGDDTSEPARRAPGDVTVFGELIGGAGLTSMIAGPNFGARYHIGRNFAISARATFDFLLWKTPGKPLEPEFRMGAAVGGRIQAPIDRSTVYLWGQAGGSVGLAGDFVHKTWRRGMMGIGYEYLSDNGWSTGFELGGPSPFSVSLNIGHDF